MTIGGAATRNRTAYQLFGCMYPFRGMCAYRCALRPALRTVSRLALRGCYKIGSSNFEPLARSYRPANRRTFTAGRYPVAGNYSLIHVLLRCVLTLWPCARPAGQSGKVRKQCPSFQAVRIGVGAPFRKLRPCSSFRAVRLWAAVRLSFFARSPSCRLCEQIALHIVSVQGCGYRIRHMPPLHSVTPPPSCRLWSMCGISAAFP
jgi:hypothetical protein